MVRHKLTNEGESTTQDFLGSRDKIKMFLMWFVPNVRAYWSDFIICRFDAPWKHEW